MKPIEIISIIAQVTPTLLTMRYLDSNKEIEKYLMTTMSSKIIPLITLSRDKQQSL
jgi:hypothetical protein